jgi:aminocarboxymuconate-semialdehyde decarboxylase
MYTPKYMKILTSRAVIPKVTIHDGIHRLIILPNEDKEETTSAGRVIGKEYWDVAAKLRFMDNHQISKSIISLANPWLDFLSGNEATAVAQELNDELQSICEQSNGRLKGFASLPMRNPTAAVKEVERLKSLSCIKGVILGTSGAGNGLDHENVREVLQAIAQHGYTIFLHPHYGVGNEHYHNTGHVLALALGFPFETTVAVSRLIVTGTLDKIPNLKILVAHAGAALPSLIGRIDSCLEHDSVIAKTLEKKPSEYFKQLYFDAIAYDHRALEALISFVGSDRIVFGTDHPFFPPPNVAKDKVIDAQWLSTNKVYSAINGCQDVSARSMILSKNAENIFQL